MERGDLRVAFGATLSPIALPRYGAAPISLSFGGRISTTDGAAPAQLERIVVALNRHGRVDRIGLPVCHLAQIQPATDAQALSGCRGALVGEGRFSARVLLAEQAPFPSRGRVLAFNAEVGGRPAVLAHVYGTSPAPTSYTIPFLISPGKGQFATTLTADLPDSTSDSGYVTGLSVRLGRSFSYRGRAHGYLSASCPAPAVFPLARGSFIFGDGRTLGATLTRACRVRDGRRSSG